MAQNARPSDQLCRKSFTFTFCVCVCEGENIHKQGLMAEFTIHGSGMEHWT